MQSIVNVNIQQPTSTLVEGLLGLQWQLSVRFVEPEARLEVKHGEVKHGDECHTASKFEDLPF